MRFLQWLWTDEGFWNPIILTLKVYGISRPDFLAGLNQLVGAFAAFMPRYTGSFVFIRRPSDAESDSEPSPGQDIESRQSARQ